MKRRIAVFANGWGTEYLQEVGRGISARAQETNTDIFAFVDFSAYADPEEENQGESSIFGLPDLNAFDGAIFLTNSFNLKSETDYLQRELWRTKIPAVSLECELEGAVFIESDNYVGMRALADHLFKEQKVKRVVFIGGFEGHKESEIRLQAVLDSAAASGVEIPADNILYGDWAAKSAERCITNWMKNHDYLPDAVICANDLMAVAVADWLADRGIEIPASVKVTGFDNLRDAKEHWPAITSVSHGWERMGRNALSLVHNMIDGIPAPKKLTIDTEFVGRESSGCVVNWDEEEIKNRLRKVNSDFRTDGITTDQHFRHLYMAVRKDKEVEELHDSLTQFFSREGRMEGKDFMLCLHPDFFTPGEDEDIMKRAGFPDKMLAVCSVNSGKDMGIEILPTKESIFHISERTADTGTYIYVPVHNEDILYGYAMLSRGFEISADTILYIWTRHMRQNMDQVWSNVKINDLNKKLAAMSVTDILTGVYNRTGCEKIIYPAMDTIMKNGGRGLVFIADVDRLKQINDNFGHNSGDQALTVTAEALKNSTPEGFFVARYGGDEFLMAGSADDDVTVDSIREAVMTEVNRLTQAKDLKFTLSLSIGGVMLEVGEKFDIVENLQVADKQMYEIKSRHHAEMDGIS